MNDAAQNLSELYEPRPVPEQLDHTPMKYGMYGPKKCKVPLTPSQIAEVNPGYIVWLHENVKDKPTCSVALYKDCKKDTASSGEYYNGDENIDDGDL